jgi:hypothetical protein
MGECGWSDWGRALTSMESKQKGLERVGSGNCGGVQRNLLSDLVWLRDEVGHRTLWLVSL